MIVSADQTGTVNVLRNGFSEWKHLGILRSCTFVGQNEAKAISRKSRDQKKTGQLARTTKENLHF